MGWSNTQRAIKIAISWFAGGFWVAHAKCWTFCRWNKHTVTVTRAPSTHLCATISTGWGPGIWPARSYWSVSQATRASAIPLTFAFTCLKFCFQRVTCLKVHLLCSVEWSLKRFLLLTHWSSFYLFFLLFSLIRHPCACPWLHCWYNFHKCCPPQCQVWGEGIESVPQRCSLCVVLGHNPADQWLPADTVAHWVRMVLVTGAARNPGNSWLKNDMNLLIYSLLPPSGTRLENWDRFLQGPSVQNFCPMCFCHG